MITQRFNFDVTWNENKWHINRYMYGFIQVLEYLEANIEHKFPTEAKMVEIGSYFGESTMLFASTGIFKEIHCIDPFKGEEEMNDSYGYDWDLVKKEFKTNTRYFDNITLHEDYSYNVIDEFKDNSIDFLYIDGNHSYEDTKKDIELYLPKIKQSTADYYLTMSTKDGNTSGVKESQFSGVIGGHDYHEAHSGVIKAVDELLGKPDEVFRDNSWVKKL